MRPGGQELAFLRGGRLIAINGDGSNARTVASGSIVSFAWSPDHHQLVYRIATGADLTRFPPTTALGAPDAPGSLNVIGINGGQPTPITPEAPDLAWSDAWWNVKGNRLVYREEFATSDPAAALAYIVSQADQPAGIARKTLPDDVSLPALSADGTQVAGIDATGAVRVATPGQAGAVVATGALTVLPVTGRPGRVLWQPGHNALLYAVASGGRTTLVLRDLRGGARVVVSVPALLDAAFSPDGTRLLVRTPDQFQLYDLPSVAPPRFTVAEGDAAALAWWSPDGKLLLVWDTPGWRLVDMATGVARTVIQANSGASGTALPAQARWHPAAGSPWSPDGTQFAFIGTSGMTWLGRALPMPRNSPTGLYVGQVRAGRASGQPSLRDSGDDRAPSWSYADPSTTLLLAS